MKWLILFFKSFRGFLEFQKIENKKIVIYLEGRHDLPHLLPIFDSLKDLGVSPILVTSEILEEYNNIYIGDGFFRILFFQILNCELILMTMPDLDRLHIKRSSYPVKYAYVFHSLSSSHTIYHEKAFDAYDIVYAAGPHHVAEIKKREEKYNLKKKTILEGGYPRVDSLIANMNSSITTKNKITIAPTWGTGSLLECDNSDEIIEGIIKTGFETFLRIHPMTIRHNNNIVQNLEKKFDKYNNFQIVTDMGDKTNLYESFMMVSDWSGASFDFSITQNLPVLFIDTPPKINNPRYENLEIEPVESQIRNKIGEILSVSETSRIGDIINKFYQNQSSWNEKIVNINDEYIFNLGKSARMISTSLVKYLHDPLGIK